MQRVGLSRRVQCWTETERRAGFTAGRSGFQNGPQGEHDRRGSISVSDNSRTPTGDIKTDAEMWEYIDDSRQSDLEAMAEREAEMDR
jgi:hypothetical protein